MHMRRFVKSYRLLEPLQANGRIGIKTEQSLLASSRVMMTADQESVERTFVFQFPTCTTKQEYRLEVPIYIPYSGSIKELTQRLISSFKLPCYVEKDLQPALVKFVKEQTIKYYDDVSEKLIQSARSGDIDVEEVIKTWEKAFRQETVEYTEPQGATDEELFSTVYHKLVHSPALEAMLQVEHSYALAVRELTGQRDEQVAALIQKQTQEMASAVEGFNVYSSEQDINQLAAHHFEDQNLLQGKWNSEVDTLKETQRKEYREWLMKMLEEHQTNVTLPTPTNSPLTARAPRIFHSGSQEDNMPVHRLEESFTIHLGSQMKQMHNIRILSADVLDFCRIRPQASSGLDPQPQRLQTALALYSNDLYGLVILTDSHIGSYSGLSKELNEVCQHSTDFHFPSVDDQLEKIRDEAKEAVAWRQSHWGRSSSGEHLVTLTSSEKQSRRSGSTKNLQTGDVYITRHSNLAEVHVIFHMVVDDSLRSSDINSRHPVILGLRNILKTACSKDITTLTVPVLLVHEMTEEMTVAWCTKRAELVFKCVKGFMIETASWGGSELKNLQFLVPKGISEEVFGTLATMLPSIFRVSNPLVFKASSSTPHTPKSG
ncbi:protein C12orf4 homolog isoform X2 [Zootermopsis nevadensis]|uniref:protein C12orf4 homolog isoform X2 n=1 Tax=Zootermopsis nevadensis TaxID=136037 RepID=UPI000B8E3D54|nr:protein C12orf4 homolog isoform X2 [Zootermopsis nevadensis]